VSAPPPGGAPPGGGGRPRARELGIVVGALPPGPLNAITDVPGVRVGHATLIRGADIRTGVTAILPHNGNMLQERVPAAIFVGNGYGKLMGATQVEELGEIETPILLTSTLNAPRAADALLEWMMALPGNEEARSINPIVGETNDGLLNDIRGRHVGREEVFAALRSATSGPVEEGALGAGTGTVAFGYKGGIGTASRVAGAWTVGALVQANYGGRLTIAGVPIAVALVEAGQSGSPDGSIIIVLATDAPLDARNLRRLGARSMLGLGRTGSSMSNGSGDYAIAFSVAPENRIRSGETLRATRLLSNDAMSPLFQAAVEATEEAIYNALFKAATMTGRGGRTVEALPIERVLEILRRHGRI
jgi:D-aminopeptidase